MWFFLEFSSIFGLRQSINLFFGSFEVGASLIDFWPSAKSYIFFDHTRLAHSLIDFWPSAKQFIYFWIMVARRSAAVKKVTFFEGIF